MAIAVTTLPGWVFFESYATTIRSKKWATKRTIELLKDKFKSQESNWEYKTEIKNKENTGQLFILIYHIYNTSRFQYVLHYVRCVHRPIRNF